MNSEYIKELKQKLEQAVSSLKEELLKIRTNRPTAAPIENIKVDYMGTQLVIKQLASLSVEPPRDIIVSPWDKASLQTIQKALEEAKLGYSISNQGNSIRLKMPELTSERQEELIKTAKSMTENIRIRIRTTRDDIKKKAETGTKDKDEKFRIKENIQKEIDSVNEQIDSMVESKIKEIQN
ncbi:MAG: ribosome recycling factor [Candidatus Colwellbacteria bacterium]|nr:ribosome recycling factor [Candidatus Colwellbacteria bacterium]